MTVTHVSGSGPFVPGSLSRCGSTPSADSMAPGTSEVRARSHREPNAPLEPLPEVNALSMNLMRKLSPCEPIYTCNACAQPDPKRERSKQPVHAVT